MSSVTSLPSAHGRARQAVRAPKVGPAGIVGMVAVSVWKARPLFFLRSRVATHRVQHLALLKSEPSPGGAVYNRLNIYKMYSGVLPLHEHARRAVFHRCSARKPNL